MSKNKPKNTVVLATNNQGKVAEMQQSLTSFGFDVLPQSKFAITEATEDGLSFVENALIKARHASKHCQLPAIADDSGLEVDELGGKPGIHSARYSTSGSDKDNNQTLLNALHDCKNRKARFHCVIVYLQHAQDPTPIICQGVWEGEIATQLLGENGFGYDPLFYLAQYQCTAAQLDSKIKKQISHRAQALVKLQQQLSHSPKLISDNIRTR